MSGTNIKNIPYADFTAHLRATHSLATALALLAWDQETYMPAGGVAGRARARAMLAGLVHERITDPALGGMIAALTDAELSAAEAANVRAARRDHERAVKVPTELVTELAEAVSLAQQAWAESRKKSDWSLFAPHLEKIVGLRLREAEAVGYEDEPWNAMLDEFEPGMRAADLEPLLESLRDLLVPMTAAIQAAGPRNDDDLLRGDFPMAGQLELSRRLLADIGFDPNRGRLDVSAHPFTTGIDPDDVRLTTHFDTGDISRSFYSTMHEGGHGLYEQGFLPAHYGTPMAEAVSLGIHESQSRLWENMVGRSREFAGHYLKTLRDIFPDRFAGVDAEALYRAINVVRPGAVRIDADEVTYNLHIILRTELERALFRGDIEVADLPSVWNQKMKQYLGLEPADDAQGVLQDIHWSCGLFGYFPTYGLGNIYAAQFHAGAGAEIGNLPELIAGGDFAPLLGWMRDKIHAKGRLLDAPDLCRDATGTEISIRPFAEYLASKYGELYDLPLADARQE